jgi:O-antigen ligase
MGAFAQRPFTFDPRVLLWAAAAVVGSAGAGVLAVAEPSAAFDVALVASCAALVVWRPFESLLVLLAVRAGWATSPSSIVFDWLTLASGGVAVLLCARRLQGWRVLLPFLAFLLIALPSVPVFASWDEGAKDEWLKFPVFHFQYARNPSNEMLDFTRLAAGAAAFAWAAWAVRTPRQLTTAIGAVIAGAAYPVVVGLQQVASGHTHVRSSGFGSAVGPFSHPNGFASFLLIAMILTLVAFMETRKLGLRIALGLLLAGGLVCLLFTYTRASWVGFTIAVVLLGALRYRRLLVIGLIAVAVAALAAPSTTKRAEQRFSDLSASSQSYARNSWTWRKRQWSRMVPFGLERPVLGRGYGSYARDTLLVYGTRDPEFGTLPKKPNGAYGFGAHNDFVKTLVETGVVGAALWALTLLGVMSLGRRGRRIPAVRPWGTAIFAVGVAITLVSLADNIQAAAVDTIYLFALAGALAGAMRTQPQRARVLVAAPVAAPVEPAPTPGGDAAAEEPEPEAEPEPEPAPSTAPQPNVRRRLGSWLRHRLR